VAYGARLEIVLGATPRGFKSRILRGPPPSESLLELGEGHVRISGRPDGSRQMGTCPSVRRSESHRQEARSAGRWRLVVQVELFDLRAIAPIDA
jgi:hypothetical protein